MLKIKAFTFNPIQENTYVISDDKGACIIVDPGCYFGNERRELTEYINNGELQPKCLLNTHCHFDHVFGNKFVAEEYDLLLHLHLLEKPVLDAAPAMASGWGMSFSNYSGELIYLKEGEKLIFGDSSFDILFTPGHSPGSISLYCATEKMLIAGDVLFRQSVGRTDLPGGDFDTLAKSIREQLFILPDDTVVYPGHGPTTMIGYEKKHNPFLV